MFPSYFKLITIKSFEASTWSQKLFSKWNEVGHYSETLIWRWRFPLQLGIVLVSISFTFVSLIYLKVKKAVSNGLDLQRYILKSCTVGGQADRQAETQTSNWKRAAPSEVQVNWTPSPSRKDVLLFPNMSLAIIVGFSGSGERLIDWLIAWFIHCLIGPILDDRLKEKILKPWKGAHSSHFVCVCVSVRKQPTGHYFWPRNLIFE